MSSMYDTIMELPLFKGIGEEQLSLMLEKTSMEFLKYEDGETVYSQGKKVVSVDFILNGRLRQSYRLNHYPITIDEIIGKGGVAGALNLYGMDTGYQSTGIAMGRLSLIRIGKAQYMNILQSDPIYLLNFLNFLSAAAQKNMNLFMGIKVSGISRMLETLAYSVVSRQAEAVVLAASDEILAEYCGVSLDEFSKWKQTELSHNRIITNSRGIILKSPHISR